MDSCRLQSNLGSMTLNKKHVNEVLSIMKVCSRLVNISLFYFERSKYSTVVKIHRLKNVHSLARPIFSATDFTLYTPAKKAGQFEDTKVDTTVLGQKFMQSLIEHFTEVTFYQIWSPDSSL